MTIGILTQPLSANYGCILQNYALQTILKREGFKVYTINRCKPTMPKSKFIVFCVGSILKRGLLKWIFRKDVILRTWWATKKETTIINQNIDQFIAQNITQTEKFFKNKFDIINKYEFDAYIVGSDQVWRPQYSPCLSNYFLDFLNGNKEVKKIVYAASFGVDNWEFTFQQTEQCSYLAKQFDAISVREDSAIELCDKYLGVEAIHVLDPTMLLKKEDYIDLIKQGNIPERENILFSYLVDESDEKKCSIHKVAEELKLHPISGMPPNSFHLKQSKKDLSDCIYMPVTEWIAGFRDAKFIITDSFHGTVFAILFNKPFVVFENENRGNARLNSLLKMFKIENRLITSNVNFETKLYDLDYSEINRIIEKERDKSLTYLLIALVDTTTRKKKTQKFY